MKIGGSLFDLPDLHEKLIDLTQLVEGDRVIVPGGGALTDVVRGWDEKHLLGQRISHHLAMQTLSISANFLAALNERFHVVDNLSNLEAIWEAGNIPILDLSRIILNERPLPELWDVTSDSISAWVAEQFAEAELILVKSQDLPHCRFNITDLVQQGLVDAYFPQSITSPMQIRWVNLRQSPLAIKPVNQFAK